MSALFLLGFAFLAAPSIYVMARLIALGWPLLFHRPKGERNRLAKARPGVHLILAELESAQLDRMRARRGGRTGLRSLSYSPPHDQRRAARRADRPEVRS